MALRIATVTGTQAQPNPLPTNHGGSICTETSVGQAQQPIRAALQAGLDLSQEVNSLVEKVAAASSPARDARTMLLAIQDVVHRMVRECGDLTAVRNYTP